MIKFVKHKTPFILLTASLIFAISSYFGFYVSIFVYLGDILGYSIMTNLFMYAYYMNNHFCTSTKVAVLGLFALNIFSLLQKYFNLELIVYDIFICIIAIFVISFLKINKWYY